MNNVTFDLRMLLLVGLLAGSAATHFREDDKSFNMWSNIATTCLGASIGVLKERADVKPTRKRTPKKLPND